MLFLNNSITRLSYGANPATSLTTLLTNFVFDDWMPLRWLGLTVFAITVVDRPIFMPTRISRLGECRSATTVLGTWSKGVTDSLFSWPSSRSGLVLEVSGGVGTV